MLQSLNMQYNYTDFYNNIGETMASSKSRNDRNQQLTRRPQSSKSFCLPPIAKYPQLITVQMLPPRPKTEYSCTKLCARSNSGTNILSGRPLTSNHFSSKFKIDTNKLLRIEDYSAKPNGDCSFFIRFDSVQSNSETTLPPINSENSLHKVQYSCHHQRDFGQQILNLKYKAAQNNERYPFNSIHPISGQTLDNVRPKSGRPFNNVRPKSGQPLSMESLVARFNSRQLHSHVSRPISGRPLIVARPNSGRPLPPLPIEYQPKPQQSNDIAQPNNEVLYQDSQPSFEQNLCNAPPNSEQSNFGQSPQDLQPIRQCLDNTNSNSELPRGDAQSIHTSRRHFESNPGQPLDVEHHASQPTHNSLYDAQPDSGQSFDVTQPNSESSHDYARESDAQDDYTEDSLPMESHSIQPNEDCSDSEQSLSTNQHNPVKSWRYIAHPDLELSYYLQCSGSKPITLQEFHTFRLTSNFGRPLPLLHERFLPLEYLLINGIVDYVPAYMRFPVRPYYRRIQTLPTVTLIPIPEYPSVESTSETSDSSTSEQPRIEEPKQIIRTTSFSRVVYSKSSTEQSRSEDLKPKPMIRTTSFSRVDYSKVQSTKETQLLQPSNPPTNMTYSGESNSCSSVRSYLSVKEDTPIACPLAISFRCYISAARYIYDDTSSESSSDESISYVSDFEEYEDEGISSILSENSDHNGQPLINNKVRTTIITILK